MRRRLTNVPLSEPWSSTKKAPSRSTSTAWLRETVTSSRKISHSGERPMRVRSPAGVKRLPRPPAARAHDQRRPLEPVEQVVGELADLGGRVGLRRLRRRLGFSSSAPQREQ